ncbi:MAG: four helix bundle protein [Terriglobia bacterium]|jgi:four helix bundle protein
MQDFKKLKVWDKAHQLTLAVYKATAHFPREELYGLTNQTRRSAASIVYNIAEGCGRAGRAEFARFLQMATGSASELEYQLLLAHDLKFLRDEEYRSLESGVVEVKRMLSSLMQRLRTEN